MSLCVFGVTRVLDVVVGRAGVGVGAARVAAALCAGRGAGGGRLSMGASSTPRPSRRVFLRVAISWRRARFSDWVEPSSERMASRRRSRSAMSPSRVDIYSVWGLKGGGDG